MNIQGTPKTRTGPRQRMSLETKTKRVTALKEALKKALNTPKQPTAPIAKGLKEARKHAKVMLGSFGVKKFRRTQDIMRDAVAAVAGAHERLSNMAEQAEKPNTRRTTSVKRRIIKELSGEELRRRIASSPYGVCSLCPSFAEAVRRGRP